VGLLIKLIGWIMSKFQPTNPGDSIPGNSSDFQKPARPLYLWSLQELSGVDVSTLRTVLRADLECKTNSEIVGVVHQFLHDPNKYRYGEGFLYRLAESLLGITGEVPIRLKNCKDITEFLYKLDFVVVPSVIQALKLGRHEHRNRECSDSGAIALHAIVVASQLLASANERIGEGYRDAAVVDLAWKLCEKGAQFFQPRAIKGTTGGALQDGITLAANAMRAQVQATLSIIVASQCQIEGTLDKDYHYILQDSLRMARMFPSPTLGPIVRDSLVFLLDEFRQQRWDIDEHILDPENAFDEIPNCDWEKEGTFATDLVISPTSACDHLDDLEMMIFVGKSFAYGADALRRCQTGTEYQPLWRLILSKSASFPGWYHALRAVVESQPQNAQPYLAEAVSVFANGEHTGLRIATRSLLQSDSEVYFQFLAVTLLRLGKEEARRAINRMGRIVGRLSDKAGVTARYRERFERLSSRFT